MRGEKCLRWSKSIDLNEDVSGLCLAQGEDHVFAMADRGKSIRRYAIRKEDGKDPPMELGKQCKTNHGLNLSKLLMNSGEDSGAHLITASLDGSISIIPVHYFDRQEIKDTGLISRSAKMFSRHQGGIAKLDVFLATVNEILLLAVDAGGTLQLLHTQNGEAGKDGYTTTLQASPRVDIDMMSADDAKMGFDLEYFSNKMEYENQPSDIKQSWTAWKIGLDSREKWKDFERQISDVERSLMTVKHEIVNLMSSNSSLPGEDTRKKL